MRREVFVTGGTGYLGREMIARLLERGHAVRGLARRGSEGKLPAGCAAVIGDALERATYAGRVAPADTFVQLVGTPHPTPWKGRQFRAVDLRSGREAVAAAAAAGVPHFVYVSVAHPAPLMKSYVEARSECEAAIRASHLNATILRPWYVLGPGHWWPYALRPAYRIAESLPALREGARRLGLVTRAQMVAALVEAVENPCQGIRVLEVPAIRNSKLCPERAIP